MTMDKQYHYYYDDDDDEMEEPTNEILYSDQDWKQLFRSLVDSKDDDYYRIVEGDDDRVRLHKVVVYEMHSEAKTA